MRLLVDSLIASMLVVVLGGILWHRSAAAQQVQRVEATQQALRAIEAQALLRASTGEVPATPWGYPVAISPAWFSTLPQNLLADCPRWLEIAHSSTADLSNPPHVTADARHAAFWYNPYRGILRARVAFQMSQQATIELYNLVNGTTLRADDAAWSHDD